MIELDGMRDEKIKLTLAKLLPKGHPKMGEIPILFFNIRLLDGRKIGTCDLRLGNSAQTEIMGQVGYGIDEAYRGNHYAERACRLLFRYAERAHMKCIEITCDTDNIASIRTCERLGGIREDKIIFVPPECIDYQNGSRKKYRYLVFLP